VIDLLRRLWAEVEDHQRDCPQSVVSQAMEDEVRAALEGQPEHIASPRCWCAPVIHSTDPVTGVSVWVHKGKQ